MVNLTEEEKVLILEALRAAYSALISDAGEHVMDKYYCIDANLCKDACSKVADVLERCYNYSV